MSTVPQSVVELDEASLAQWLLAGAGPWRSLLGWQLALPPYARARFRIPVAKLDAEATEPGDVDALLFAPGAPGRTVAIECKRVKVKAGTFVSRRPNRLSELEHGAAQANALLDLGFHRVYLLVAVAVDGYDRPGNWLDRGLTEDLWNAIYAALPAASLRWEGGLAVVIGVQPTQVGIFDSGGVGCDLVRDAVPRKQPARLTEAVRRLPWWPGKSLG